MGKCSFHMLGQLVQTGLSVSTTGRCSKPAIPAHVKALDSIKAPTVCDMPAHMVCGKVQIWEDCRLAIEAQTSLQTEHSACKIMGSNTPSLCLGQ